MSRDKNFNGCFYGRQTPTKYEIKQQQARDKAVEYQLWASEQNLSYGELYEFAEYFRKLAKRYGLIKEFRENGII